MQVPVTYTGPRESLHLSWTTDGLDFRPGEATLVPEGLIPLLKELSGHGFQFPAPATQVGAEVLEPAEAPADEPAPAPKKAGRKPKEA